MIHIVISILLVVVAGTIAQELPKDYCSVVDIESAKAECYNVYADGRQDNLHKICQNVECFLQCLNDAIGDCSSREWFFREDFEVYKTLYRAQCANHTLTEIALEVCRVETPCIDDQFHKEQVEIMNKLANASNAVEAKELECRLSARSKTCITVSPNNSCTQEMAKLRQNIEIVKHSHSMCSIAHDHPFFEEYGSEIKCINPKVKSDCFTASVMSRLSKCTPVTLTSFMSQDRGMVDTVCASAECTSQCYRDAVGNCNTKDQFVMLDPTMIKVSTRAACDNMDEIASTIQQCRMADMSCLHVLGKSLATAHALVEAQKYKDFKDLVCSATSRFRSCIEFGVNENCSESKATLAKNLYEVWHTYSGCGRPDNTMFKTYSGELTCDSSGDQKSSSMLNVILLLILYNLFHLMF